MIKSVVYTDVLNVFRSAQGKTASQLSKAVLECDIPQQLKSGVCTAIEGDNRPLNNWLFTEGFVPGQCIAWIAPIRSDTPRYVWMVGEQNKKAILVHEWFRENRAALAEDAWLSQQKITPPLLFVDTFEVSKVSVGELQYEDEFSIFQVGYKDAPVEVSDLDQKMIINTAYTFRKRYEALVRLQWLGWLDPRHTESIKTDMEIYAIIHSEGHNQGHFVGSWPFEDDVKKKCVLYEAVEEFKACLASIAMAEHLPLTDVQRNNYALSVFMSRFLGFGFEGYCLERQRRETVREITVGLMFFEWLVQKRVIKLGSDESIVSGERVRLALLEAYRLIFKQEASLKKNDHDGLKKVARFWYHLAFPGGTYSHEAKSVYNRLREASTK